MVVVAIIRKDIGVILEIFIMTVMDFKRDIVHNIHGIIVLIGIIADILMDIEKSNTY